MTETLTDPQTGSQTTAATCSWGDIHAPEPSSSRCGRDAVYLISWICHHEHIRVRPHCGGTHPRVGDDSPCCRDCMAYDGHRCGLTEISRVTL